MTSNLWMNSNINEAFHLGKVQILSAPVQEHMHGFTIALWKSSNLKWPSIEQVPLLSFKVSPNFEISQQIFSP